VAGVLDNNLGTLGIRYRLRLLILSTYSFEVELNYICVTLLDVTARALHSNGPTANTENAVPVLLAACVLRGMSSNRFNA
jgi:hypothetical protein